MRQAQSSYRLDDWVVHPQLNELSKGKIKVHLEPLAMDVLIYLSTHSWKVVSAKELLERYWPNRSAESRMVSKRINQIRAALGDNAKAPRFVETIPKRGYRVIAPVFALDETMETQNQLATGQPVKSMAVLPFRNLSGDTAQNYIAEAITEELIAELANNIALQVKSRTSSMSYGDSQLSLPEIAKELGVQTILEGSVAIEGTRCRAMVRIVDASQDKPVWVYKEDREFASVLSIRTRVARAVSRCEWITG